MSAGAAERSDLRLLGVWIRAGLRTLVRTPRAAFFTFVFPPSCSSSSTGPPAAR